MQSERRRNCLFAYAHHASRNAKNNFIFAARTVPRGGKKGRGNSSARRALQTAVLFPQRAE